METVIADLEGGSAAFAFGSGMAAIAATLLLFKPGVHLVVCEDVYGGAFRLMTNTSRMMRSAMNKAEYKSIGFSHGRRTDRR